MKKYLNKEIEAVISSLDLSKAKKRLLEIPGWDEKKANKAEKEYRRFLYLIKLHPDVPLVPTEELDELWHQHILDTRKYAEDCQNIFGFFLHHNPNLEKGSKELETLFEQTKKLYKKSFLTEIRNSVACLGNGASCAGRCHAETRIEYEGSL